MSKISTLPAAAPFAGNEAVVVVQGGATKRGGIGSLVQAAALPFLAQAQEAATAALASAATAAISRKVYASTALGLDATIVGDFFFTPGGADDFLTLWSHDADHVATNHGSLPSASLLTDLDAAGEALAGKASASALGVPADAPDMGLFAGVIPDNSTAKEAFFALEAAVSDGIAVNAAAKEFVADRGQTLFTMPFILKRQPALKVNGVDIDRAYFTYSGADVTLSFNTLQQDDLVKISVSDTEASPVYDINGPFVLRDLSPDMTVPAPGVYFGQGGNSLSFQTMISSDTGTAERDNQRGMLLLVADTTDDGNSEEQTLCLLTRINTGYAKDWATSTAFDLGDNISRPVPINGVYRCIQAGISANSGPGPTGTGLNIVDGTCRWMWINAQAINAKVSIYNEVLVEENAGNSWAQANNFELHPGFKSPFAVNTEFDLSNHSGIDSVFGGVNRHNLYVVTQGASTSTASIEVATTNTAKWAALWGLHFSGGGKLASNSIIGIDADSARGIGIGIAGGGAFSPTFTDAAFVDGSHAPKALRLAGDYSSSAIEISGNMPAALSLVGSFSGWLIYSPVFEIDKSGNVQANSLSLRTLPPNYANDGAAAAAGVALGGVYRNGSALHIRAA